MIMRRGKTEIMADILKTCREDGAGKTRIVYQANLNFRTVQPYLDLLEKRGLLEIRKTGNRDLFVMTEKGDTFIKNAQSMSKMLEG